MRRRPSRKALRFVRFEQSPVGALGRPPAPLPSPPPGWILLEPNQEPTIPLGCRFSVYSQASSGIEATYWKIWPPKGSQRYGLQGTADLQKDLTAALLGEG